MACREELSIQQRDSALSERSQSNSDADETTKLLGNKSPLQRNGFPLLRRFKESVLIKSKAVNTILFWNALAYLLYGFLYNPDTIFILATAQSLPLGAPFIALGSGVYGLIAVWLLFYPLAGYLADVRYGRYKVVRCGLLTMWLALFTFIVVGLALFAVCSIPLPFVGSVPWPPLVNGVLVVLGVSGGLLVLLIYIALSVGFAAFSANVIQFGIDQLRDSPTRDSFLFIHWFVLTMYIGLSVGKLMWVVFSDIISVESFGIFGIAFFFFLIAVPVSLCFAKQSLFIHDTGLGNPYKEVARIVGFARKHSIPIQRSAFTFWEDDIPTGLNLGKNKYGGPFTTEQVENVKAFFGILLVLISLGPFFTADIAGSAILPLVRLHFSGYSSYSIANALFANGGTCYPLFIVLFIPIFLKFLYPLFQRYATSILGRIGIGLCLTTVSLVCSLSMDKIGHDLLTANITSSLFAAENFKGLYANPLNLNPYILTPQNILIAISYTLIYGGVFEFICAQSPHSMKGFLIGIFFAVKGLFQLIGVFAILLPFSFWTDSPQVGLAYFLLNIVISISGVVFFILAARRYQYRQREEFCNERKYIEEFYEKDVRHNQDFEDLHFEFDSKVDSD
ncbi:solute carrier family 15 member 4-like [Halichondria panicea]|uniref:solute carrier family 15 member 4-like n=1 Tax=Halichondria panicea TaxID=6063 RepID=UPI00312BB3A3